MRLQSPHRADRALGTGKENEFLYLGLGGSKGDPGEEPQSAETSPAAPEGGSSSEAPREARPLTAPRHRTCPALFPCRKKLSPCLGLFSKISFFFFSPLNNSPTHPYKRWC